MYGDGRKLLVSGAYSTMEVALRVIYNSCHSSIAEDKKVYSWQIMDSLRDVLQHN